MGLLKTNANVTKALVEIMQGKTMLDYSLWSKIVAQFFTEAQSEGVKLMLRNKAMQS